MCPDLEILSTYYDDEIPETHRKEIEIHVSSCQKCQKILKEFENISGFMEQVPEPDFTASAGNVWDRISDSLEKDDVRQDFWHRKVWFSFPAAAAVAAAFIAVFSISVLSYYIGRNSTSAPVVSQELNLTDAKDYSQSVEQLFEDDTLDFVIPASDSFVHAGEPLLIREVDFKARRY